MKPSSLTAALALTLLCLTGCISDVDSDVGVDEDEQPPADGEVLDISDASPAIAGCNTVTTVLLYSESTNAFTLPNAFAAAVDPCTNYYVYLPALTTDKTEVRASADKVHALGPNFHAMAEFHWAAWREWIAMSPGTRDWRIAGHAFRQRMIDAGYKPGDIWGINEFPTSTRTGEEDVWIHERNAVKGLAEGPAGSGTVRGAVFLAGMGQSLQNMSVYKPNIQNWLQQDGWWSDMADTVAFFGYEVYADPHNNCVDGSNVPTDRAYLNTYLEHIPNAARAGGAKTATAWAYLKRHYVPLMQAAFGADIGFGDNRIGLEDFTKFMRLQVYATHYYAAQNGSPGRRLGFAWAPSNLTTTQEQNLASQIAGSVQRSYPANDFFNLGKYACASTGSLNGCGCTTAGSYNTLWDNFDNW